MQKIVERIPVPLLKEQISKSKPVLGICVGMQVFSSLGYEHGETVGLDLIEGDVRLLPDHGLPIPHIGWNSMNIASESPLFRNLPNNPDFYFLHSYFFQPKNNLNVLATTDYGLAFPSVVGINNLFGVQFHPEKSQKNGRLLLKNFLEIV
jgi:glutamine amidotransferase